MVRDELQLLASAERQIEYERNVPNVRITAELVEVWFSQTYHPADPGFRSSFSDSELETLAKFNDVFDRHVNLLPNSRGTVQTWLVDSAWKEIMGAASDALANIAV